ncbi:MAG TPA: hypothetical protein VI172_12555 [Candidatus Dormibacteraeota bacterium]|jgi:hypothetical protein
MVDLLARLRAFTLTARLEHLHEHAQRQENIMAKLSDELDDIARRQAAIKDAITASTTNTRAALQRLETEVEALRDGDLSDEQQQRVNAIKAAADDLRTAAESADDGYEPPIVEPSPFPATGDEQPEPGSAGDRDSRSL